jgi:hypothetical protein
MKVSVAFAAATSAVALTGCIWSPTNRSDAESNSVTLTGFTFNPSQSVTLQAKNLTTGAMETIGTATTASSPLLVEDGQDLYAWSATIATAPDFWAPQINAAGGLPYSLGRIEIFPTLTSGGESLVTFNAAQEACMNANMATVGVVQAASDCGDSSSLVLFDNTGVATNPTTSGLTKLQSGTFPATSPTATWEVDSYQVAMGSSSLTVYAYLCTPMGSGPFPVQIYNHPGYAGIVGSVPPSAPPLAEDDLGNCIQGATNGWITAMSSYRGETATFGSMTYGGGESGQIETCLGEATDVLRLTTLVLARPHVNDNHALMWGWSHGGCVTDRAIEQGAPVQAAATFSAMTDITAMTDLVCGDNNASCFWPFANNWALTPTSDAMAYNWRSPVYFPADLNARTDVKLLTVQGVEFKDGIYWDTVLQPGAACELSNVMSPASTNAYLQTSGATLGGSPPDCTSYTGLTWLPSTGGPASPGWTWPNRTLLEVDGVDHFGVITTTAIWTDFMSFVSSLGWGTAPYSNTYFWKSG